MHAAGYLCFDMFISLLMAVVAQWMTFGPTISHALATTGRVAFSFWSPTQLLCNPTYLRATVGTAHPITAPFLQQNHLAIRTIQGLASSYQSFDPFLGFDGIFIFGFVEHLPLVLFAIQTLVNGLTSNAIESFTEGALEAVDVITHEAPAVAVWCFAMERVFGRRLNLLQRLLLMLFKYYRSHQRFDFSFQEFHFATVVVVFVWTRDLWSVGELDSSAQALLAEGVEAFAEHHSVARLNVQEAHHALERFRVGNHVQVVQLFVVEQSVS